MHEKGFHFIGFHIVEFVHMCRLFITKVIGTKRMISTDVASIAIYNYKEKIEKQRLFLLKHGRF